jgi:hypothetical protein
VRIKPPPNQSVTKNKKLAKSDFCNDDIFIWQKYAFPIPDMSVFFHTPKKSLIAKIAINHFMVFFLNQLKANEL